MKYVMDQWTISYFSAPPGGYSVPWRINRRARCEEEVRRLIACEKSCLGVGPALIDGAKLRKSA